MQVRKNHVFEKFASSENNFVKYSGKQEIEDLSPVKEPDKAAGENKNLLAEKDLDK